MTKKEMVEKLKKEMPNFQGTKEEVEMKTALYIYIELAKEKAFDERYFFGNSKLSKKAYQESVQDAKKPDEVANKRKITCVSLSYLYKAILSDFGIDSQVIKENPEDDHVYPVIKLKTGKDLMADIQADMNLIQTRSRLRRFRIEGDCSNKFESKLTEMLIEIGYIKEESDYRNDKIEKVKERVKGLEANEALETILKSEEIYENMEQIGVVEAYKYYKAVIKIAMTENENLQDKIYSFHCHKKENKEEMKYTICMYSQGKQNDDIKLYLFSAKEGRFLECDLLKLEQLQKEGLVLGKTGRENGIRKLKKIIEKSKLREQEEKIK